MDEFYAHLKDTDCPPDVPAEVYCRRIFALIPTTIILVLSILTYALRLYYRRQDRQLAWMIS